MKMLMSVLLFGSVFLTGCSTLNESFDCPAPKGGTCKRMDEVYGMVNGNDALVVAPRQNPHEIDGGLGRKRRYGEGVMRLWIAPYEDTDGNYHRANEVYTVVQADSGKNAPIVTK